MYNERYMDNKAKDIYGCSIFVLIIIGAIFYICCGGYENRVKQEFERLNNWALEQKTCKMVGVYAVYHKSGYPNYYVKIFETKDGSRFDVITDKLPVVGEIYELKIIKNGPHNEITIGERVK